MDDKDIQIHKKIAEHLADNEKGYAYTNSEYYFGRLCDSKELFKIIQKIINEESFE